MITHLEPDILEGEVKWALGSIARNTASGGDGIPVELFQILKDEAVKVLHSICQQIWKTQHRTGKGQLSFQSQKRAMFKLPHNCTHSTCYQSNAQNSPSWLQQYVNLEVPDVQVGLRRGRRTREQVANTHWIIEKAREYQKTSTSALLITPKPLTVWIITNCGKFFKRWEYQTTLPAS